MSRLRSIALAIADRLEVIPELAGKVIVFRRSDIESEFEKRMLKVKGVCVVVRLLTGKQLAKGKTVSRMRGSYTVSLFTVPILTQHEAKGADALMDDIISALHGWWPVSIPSNGIVWCEADSITYPDDPQYDVSVLQINAPQNT